MKKKLIACVLACATLLMGTGFAYWTDLISIKSTAETGFLDVNFTKAEYIDSNFVTTNESLGESAYNTTVRTATFDANNPDQVAFDITDLYPGHYAMFQATANNAGTVAAKLGKVNTSISGDNSMTKSMIGIALDAVSLYETEYTYIKEVKYNIFSCDHNHEHVTKWFGIIPIKYCLIPSTEVIGKTSKVDINLPEDATFEIGDQTFVRLSALSNVEVNDQLSNMLYLTNDSEMEFLVTIGMDPDAVGTYTTGSANDLKGNNDANTQNKTASVTLGLVWDQYNQQ